MLKMTTGKWGEKLNEVFEILNVDACKLVKSMNADKIPEHAGGVEQRVRQKLKPERAEGSSI